MRIRSADEATLANQIIQEGSNSPADVFYTENSPALEALGERGLLVPVDSVDARRPCPRIDSSQRGDWVGVSARVSELVYNTAQMKGGEVPELGPAAGGAELQGQGRLRALRDRLPAARHRDLEAEGAARPPKRGCTG